jgi:hypothetical protein
MNVYTSPVYGLILTASGKTHLTNLETGRPVCGGRYRSANMHGIVRGIIRTEAACPKCLEVSEVDPQGNRVRSAPDFLAIADEHRAAMLEANLAEPYIHADYDRQERLLKAALLLFTEGDADYAEAIYDNVITSGETAEWLTETYSRQDLIENGRL